MTLLMYAAVALLLVRLIVFVRLHQTARHVDVRRGTVSDYGTGPSRPAYTLMGVLSVLAYLLVLIGAAHTGVEPRWTLLVLAGAAVAQVALMAFPTDLTGTTRTATGVVHWVLAIATFAGLFTFMTSVDTGSGLVEALTWVARVAFYAFLATLLPRLRGWIGLTERWWLTVVPVWFGCFAVVLAR
ncbi:DUF998 domain-containing protein [Nocardioides sp. LML1-1-1.1]|uniref:DUF998 domain-containing protein n=1 Tax=Nocardioides sp. LML1-1-1.1 TaxID=3135248 RepID=UPI0034272CF4